MKDNINIIAMNNLLKNILKRKCIKSDIVAGTILYLYFGKVALYPSLKKMAQKHSKIVLTSEYNISLGWYWRLELRGTIIASSKMQNDDEYLYNQEKVKILKDKQITDFLFDQKTNDLILKFSSGYTLKTFNDMSKYCKYKDNDETDIDLFCISGPKESFHALPLIKIVKSLHEIEYVDDYYENPDKYLF